MSNILGNMPPVFGSGYRGVVPAPTAADVSAQNILRADGTWGAGPSGTLPSQTGNGGKLLTTDGTNASWVPSLNSFSISDLTFGVGGPNAKASVVSRSASQGLVFDGTNSGSATMGSSLGTSSGTVDMVLDVPSSNPSTSRGIFTVGPNSASANYANAFHGELRTDGKIWINLSGSTTGDYRRAESSSSLVSLFGGKRIRLTVVRDSSASTLTVYANGVALAMTETTGGTPPAWSGSITGTYFVPGRISATENHIGYYALSGFYNRALSASEVVSLYEAGAPAGADYPVPVAGTGITNLARNSTFTDSATDWTGGTLDTVNDEYDVTSPTSISLLSTYFGNFSTKVGMRLRVAFTIANHSGGSVSVSMTGSVSDGIATGLGNGSYTYDFVCTKANNDRIAFSTFSAGSWSLKNVTITVLGLLLAPDAAQAGGGLVWYDTSGNAANITLPASGVSWNVPFGNNIAASGTNQNITLTPSGTGFVTAQSSSSTGDVFKVLASGGAGLLLGQNSSAGQGPYIFSTGALRFGADQTERGRFATSTGNFIIGSPFTDGGQKLQVNGTANITGEVAIGTLSPGNNTAAHFLTGYAANLSWPARISAIYDANFVDTYVTLNGTLTGTRATPTFTGATTGGAYLRFNGGTSEFVLGTYVGGAGAAAVPALTLKTGDATFAGRIIATGTSLTNVHSLTNAWSGNNTLAIRNNSTSGYSAVQFLNDSGTEIGTIGTGNSVASATALRDAMFINAASGKNLIFSVSGTETGRIDTSGNATFTGSIKTGAPTTGTAGAWKLGIRVAATTTLDTTQYLQVDIGGTLYKVALVTS